MLNISDVEKALPPQLKTNVSQEMVDSLNNLSTDPLAAKNIRDNFISYSFVMKEGKFKLVDYVHAVAYVSYKVMGLSNKDSYWRTFPERYQNLTAKGASDKDISSYVSAYNKNKLVNLILEQTLIPSWVLNQDAYQRAINTQLDLMQNAKSEKVKCDAANSILTQLKRPETKQVELTIETSDNSGLNELKGQLNKMAEMQQNLINQGVPTKKIADARIIEAEVIE